MKILKRLLPAQDVDALLGDIAEEAPRRSRIWFWSQLLAVFIVGTGRDVRQHPVLALRATAIGFISLMAMGPAVTLFRDVATGAGFMWHGRWIGLPWYWHAPYSPSYWAVFRVWSIAAPMMLGWIIVRLHRAHGLTMLLAFRGAWMLSVAATFLWYAILSSLRPDHTALLSSLAGQFQVVVIQNFVISSFLMLAGGCFGTRRPDVA